MVDQESAAGFLTFLAQMQDGRLSDELTERMKGLVAAMTEQARNAGGKPKGRITLALDFLLEDGRLDVIGDVTVKPPKMIRSRSVFWPLIDGTLSPSNPKQLEMPLQTKEKRTPIRDVPHETASQIFKGAPN